MRLTLPKLAASAAILFVAACSDNTAIPTSAPTTRVAAAGKAPAFDYTAGGRTGLTSSNFTVTPQGGSFSINGIYTISFSQNAVCDPTKTVYSDPTSPCVLLNGNINVQATLSVSPFGIAVDFQPELRFAPTALVTISTDVFAPVIIAGRNYFQQNPDALQPLAMFYLPSLGAAPVPDYLTDPDAVTHIDLKTGRVWRRIKHFSGYNVTSGDSCDPSPDDPDCIEVDGF